MTREEIRDARRKRVEEALKTLSINYTRQENEKILILPSVRGGHEVLSLPNMFNLPLEDLLVKAKEIFHIQFGHRMDEGKRHVLHSLTLIYNDQFLDVMQRKAENVFAALWAIIAFIAGEEDKDVEIFTDLGVVYLDFNMMERTTIH